MDTAANDFDQKIVKRILDALNNGEISFPEAQQISKFFLLNSDNKTDMYAFLEAMSKKWQIFEPLFTQAKSQVQYSQEDAAKLDKIKEQLIQFSKTQ